MPAKSNKEDFIKKSIIMHGQKYDYSRVIYTNSTTPVEIICNVHGPFWQVAYYHLEGNGCTACGINKRTDALRKSKEIIIDRANKTHNYYYDYSLVEYVASDKPVTIICPKHGKFSQTLQNHFGGARCPLCYRSSYLKDDFIEKAHDIHSSKYDYSLITSEFVSSNDKINIICPMHGVFTQQKRQHMIGRGCPHPGCCRTPNSKLQIEWITSLKIPGILAPHRLNDLKLSVDGYDQKTNTVYEFYGDFWHGNPKVFRQSKVHPLIKATFGVLYDKTIKREAKIKKAGYNVISIWELDWLNKKKRK